MIAVSGAFHRIVSSRWICNSCIRRHVSSYTSTTATTNTSALRNIPNGPTRTRFAPSPTGYLHLGSLRTALYNYLLAKSTGGQFLLRIEDTDQKRTVAGAEDRLHEDLEWAGLELDEGPRLGGPYGPYRQSQRTALYREHADMLLRSGHAYRCFCPPERLHAIAKQRTELGLPADYDRTCTHLSEEEAEDRAAKGEAHVIRFMVPSIYPQYTDLVYGKVRNRQDQNPKLKLSPAFEDPVIIKSDGFPTYHLANVVDDHHMKITHVVRGAEWMSSTPKHLAMYNAFQWLPPDFAHVALLTDQSHQKLSKRNMDVDIAAFRDKMGVFPETLTNFVALLGWSHQNRSDVMDLKELIDNFTMKFTTGDTVVTFEKLWFLQRAHAQRYAESEPSRIWRMTRPILKVLKGRNWIDNENSVPGRQDAEVYVTKVVQLDARNYTDATAFVERNKYFFQVPTEQALLQSRPSGNLHHVSRDTSNDVRQDELFEQILQSLENITANEWTTERIRDRINTVISEKALKTFQAVDQSSFLDSKEYRKSLSKSWSKLIHSYIRWAVSGGLPGPDGAGSMEILGKEETMTRLMKAVKVLKEEQPNGHENQDAKATERTGTT